ncbi:unnamed protein product, partial [Meganyctiphanes norvegica]
WLSVTVVPLLDLVMKLLGVIFILLVAYFEKCHGAPRGVASVESLISSMQESFKDLSTRRDMWKTNYDTIRYEGGYEGENLVIPISQSFDAKHQSFNVELFMVMGQEKNYRVEVRNNKRLIVGVDIDMDDREIQMTDQTEESCKECFNERIKLSEKTGDFPNIHVDKNTQINIQVADDCVFITFWWGDMNMSVPQWLGPTYHFCSEIYENDGPATYQVLISNDDDADNSDELEDYSPIMMTIYDGLKSFSLTDPIYIYIYYLNVIHQYFCLLLSNTLYASIFQ